MHAGSRLARAYAATAAPLGPTAAANLFSSGGITDARLGRNRIVRALLVTLAIGLAIGKTGAGAAVDLPRQPDVVVEGMLLAERSLTGGVGISL